MKIENAVIVPIGGINESITGLSIDGWTVKKVEPYSLNNTVFENVPDNELHKLINEALKSEELIPRISYGSVLPFPVPFFALIKETKQETDISAIVAAVRLCKNNKFCAWHPLRLQFGRLMPEGPAYNYYLAPDGIPPIETEDFPLITSLNSKIKEGEYPEIVWKMVLFYNDAFNNSNPYLSFTLRIIVLEMLLSGNTELSYRLRHSLAVFLGRNKEESIDIDNNVKKLYTARSIFLHDGAAEKIDEKCLDLAIEYSRRLILNLLQITDSIDDLRIKLDQSGFGENPYNVTM